MSTTALNAYKNRTDLSKFSPNSLLLFALELRFSLDDIDSVAATAITDGSRDRKCDLVYIDSDSRTAVLAQGYESSNLDKMEAPASKAADLGTAASWVLGYERPDDLGPSLQSAASELHQAIVNGEVDTIELWYSHNLPESKNVTDELERACSAADAIIRSRYQDLDINVRALEVGSESLEDWYKSARNSILVTDEIVVPVDEWFSESGDGWGAVCTSVPASWLHMMFETYGDRLFSANVRGYMPRRRSAQNINFGIEKTARDQPGRFWAFNNGVTALVQNIEATKETQSLKVAGMAIVNGAQTTGSLGRVAREALGAARVLIRFVQAQTGDLVEDIIRYNNSQNQIKPSDFRSGDRYQDRLREQFKAIPDATYLGARRGGPDDRARKPSNLIPSDTAAQALAAFHLDPGTAYHELRSIWERDEVYSRYFSEQTTAIHIVFCYSLWQSVAALKTRLNAIAPDDRTEQDREALDFLRRRGSLSAVAGTAEAYLGRALTDTFSLSFGTATSPDAATSYWTPLVEALMPFAPDQLGSVFDSGGLRRKEDVEAGLKRFKVVVNSAKKYHSAVFDEFRSHVVGL